MQCVVRKPPDFRIRAFVHSLHVSAGLAMSRVFHVFRVQCSVPYCCHVPKNGYHTPTSPVLPNELSETDEDSEVRGEHNLNTCTDSFGTSTCANRALDSK